MIETQRLFISLITLEDCEDARLLHNEPETLTWLSDTHEVSRGEQKSWFLSLQQSTTSKRYIARTRTDSKLIGVFRFDNHDHLNRSADVGLDIEKNSRRQGYAREIYLAMIPYFFEELSLNRLSLLTLESNVPAISLYESLGFKREGVLRQAFIRNGNRLNAFQYSLLSSEFEKRYES
jgi:RimJ/RimL family protein N-acetyltransferase